MKARYRDIPESGLWIWLQVLSKTPVYRYQGFNKSSQVGTTWIRTTDLVDDWAAKETAYKFTESCNFLHLRVGRTSLTKPAAVKSESKSLSTSQKNSADDVSLPKPWWWMGLVEAFFPCSTINQNHYQIFVNLLTVFCFSMPMPIDTCACSNNNNNKTLKNYSHSH